MTQLDERTPIPEDIDPGDLVVAAECVIRAGRCTRAMVQRKLRVRWETAGRVIDELATAGVVGGEVSGADRVVLVEPEDLQPALARLRNTWAPPVEEEAVTPPPSFTKILTSPIAAPDVEVMESPRATLVKRPAADLATPTATTTPPRERPLLVAVRRGGAHLVTTLAKPDATHVQAARFATRHGWVVSRGAMSWANRAYGGATHGHLREQVRIARLAGDREGLKEWIELLNDARNDRIHRLVNLPKALLGVLLAIGVAAGLALVLALLVGVVSFFATGPAGWVEWWALVGATLAFLAGLVAVVWHVATWLLWPVLGWAAWREGKRVADPPLWLLTTDEKKLMGAEITPSKVVVALRDLGISELRKALKEAVDAGAGMLGPIAIAGCGVEVDILLPSGVDTSQVQGRRRRLAENLTRHEYELFITIPAARTVRLWIAHPGALDQPIGPSPLVIDHSIKANVRTGKAPWGQNLRGDAVAISLWQRHLLITGLSNQGKTAALRALALWLAFDVHPEFRIADLKGFRDWSMFAGLATVLIEGPTDEHVIAATEMLEEGVAEMERRLSSGRDDWPSLFLIVDEAQQAYMCPVVGPDKRPYGGTKATSRFFMAARKLHNQGRAVGVLLWQGTQDPTDQNLPKLVREGAHIRASLVVGTPEQASMALGDKAVDGGAAPHLLRQGLDKGTLVVAGDGVDLPPGEASITLRTHFIDKEPAWEVARRAIERRRKAGKLALQAEPGTVIVDHLVDIHAAMRGEPKVRTVVLLGRLIEENAAVYEPWGSDDLAKALREYFHLGLDIRKSDGQSVVRLDEVERATRERE